MKNKKIVMAMCIAMGINCSVGMAADIVTDTPGNVRPPASTNLGNDNLTYRDDGTSAFGNLVALTNSGTNATFTGTGTLALESDKNKNSDYTMLLVGKNSFFLPGEQLTVDMGKLKITADGSVKGDLQGIEINGDGHAGVHNAIKVSGDTELNITNTYNDNAWGIALTNTNNYALVDAEFQKINATVSSSGSTVGIRMSTNYDGKTNLLVNDETKISSNGSKQAYGLQIRTNGLKGTNTATFKKATNIEAIAGTMAVGVYTAPTDSGVNIINYQDDAKISATGQSAYGLYNNGSTKGENNLSFAKAASIEAKATGTTSMAISVYSNVKTASKNSYTFNEMANIKATADNYYAYGIYFKGDGADAVNTAKFNKGINLTPTGASTTGLYAKSTSNASNTIDIAGSTYIKADYITQAYGLGSVINVNKLGGGLVQGLGILYAADDGLVNWRMDQDNSFLDGSLVSKTGGTINLTATGKTVFNGFTGFSDEPGTGVINVDLQNAALWNLNASSKLTTLSNNTATINMQQTGTNKYETITAQDYAGTGGTLIMDTDLKSETDGDKLIITNGTSAGSGYIQVYDKSLVDGTLDGPKKLLVVEDTNGTTSWQGKSLDTGGLWTINPTIEKIGNDWYLVLEKKEDPVTPPIIPVTPNPTADTFIGLTDAAYTNWRAALTDDTLRKRLGDLRYHEDESGTWARVKAGKLSSPHYDGSYQTYQVGVDTKKDDTNYGVAIDHNRGAGNYALGKGSNSMTNLSLYATSYHPSGVYNDFVIKAGRYYGDISVSSNNDTADYGVWAYSASYELGKTLRETNGWFLEPQAQVVYGYMQGSDYTSKLGVTAHRDAIHSLLGRVGLVAGRQINETSDYYVKANMWREFAGTGAINLTAVNNYGDREFMPEDGHHKDTWFELGLGGNAKIARKTHIYGDILKTFGADIQKTWQINAGVRWEF